MIVIDKRIKTRNNNIYNSSIYLSGAFPVLWNAHFSSRAYRSRACENIEITPTIVPPMSIYWRSVFLQYDRVRQLSRIRSIKHTNLKKDQ